MKFAEAIKIMSDEDETQNRETFFKDDYYGTTYRVNKGIMEYWNLTSKTWEDVTMPVDTAMNMDYMETYDPEMFKLTFVQAIKEMVENGKSVRNGVYPTLIYSYKDGKFTALNTEYPNEDTAVSFMTDEVSTKWGIVEKTPIKTL